MYSSVCQIPKVSLSRSSLQLPGVNKLYKPTTTNLVNLVDIDSCPYDYGEIGFNSCEVIKVESERTSSQTCSILDERDTCHYKRVLNVAFTNNKIFEYTRLIASYGEQYGVKCNTICIGYNATTICIENRLMKIHYAGVLQGLPLSGSDLKHDVSLLINYLMNSASSYINSTIFSINKNNDWVVSKAG